MFAYKNLPRCLAMIAATFTLISCVDESYDGLLTDSSKLNLDLNLLKNLEIPVGSFKEMRLGDFLELDGSGYVKVQPNGDYWFEAAMDPVEFDYAFNENLALDLPNETVVVNLGSVTLPPFNVGDLPPCTLPIRENVPMDMEENFPKTIKDLKTASFDGTFTVLVGYDKSIPVSKIILAAGTRLTLPSWLVLGGIETVGTSIVDSHVISVDKDLEFTADKGLSLKCRLSGVDNIPSGEGIVSPGLMRLSGEVSLDGNVVVNLSDIAAGSAGEPVDIVIQLGCSVGNLAFTEAVVKLDMTSEIMGFDYDLPELPDFMAGNEFEIDVNDLYAFISLDHNIPAGFSLSADMSTFAGGSEAHHYALRDMDFPAASSRTMVISEKGYDGNGVTNYTVPGFSKLLNPIPDKISVSGIKLDVADEWMTLKASERYRARIALDLKAPFSLGQNARASVSNDFDLSLDFEDAYFTEAEIHFSYSNTIPVSVDLIPLFLDSEGNEIPGLKINSCSVSAGQLGTPARGDVCLLITSDGPIYAPKLRLEMTLSSAIPGVCFNEAQYLKIDELWLKLNSGIFIPESNRE